MHAGAGAEILVRAQRGDRLIETRFDKVDAEPGRKAVSPWGRATAAWL
ncbi:MAG TPA: hypothetical protein VKB17_10355 [Thermoleophilaceae bacterium]|nr:hypothetical protein [Thermoleophilaceae bacterium]